MQIVYFNHFPPFNLIKILKKPLLLFSNKQKKVNKHEEQVQADP